jgi:ketosteroid isomerase-like protein
MSVRAVTLAYRDAWLANDSVAVMATLTDDAILLPSGMIPIVGSAAIKAFWWPAGARPTKILAMDLSIEEVGGEGGAAYVRGRGSVTFS